MPVAPPNVTDKSSGYDARIEQWRKIRDVLEGEDQVKEKRSTYMPRPKAQDLEAYTRYVDRSNFYAVAERTTRGLVGQVFRISPMLELPEQVEELIFLPNHEQLCKELSVLTWHEKPGGKIGIESKKDLAARSVKSPDFYDTLVLTYVPARPTARQEKVEGYF